MMYRSLKNENMMSVVEIFIPVVLEKNAKYEKRDFGISRINNIHSREFSLYDKTLDFRNAKISVLGFYSVPDQGT